MAVNDLQSFFSNVFSFASMMSDARTGFGDKPVTEKFNSEYWNYTDSIITDLQTVRNRLNIGQSSTYSYIKNSMIEKFNKFLIAYPDLYLPKSFGHIFFTRPDLNLYDPNTNYASLLPTISNDPTFSLLHKTEDTLLRTLTTKAFSTTHDFNPFLSNKAESFETKDVVLKTMEYGETFTGYKVKYGKNTIESETADEISIMYTEDSDYRVYKIHKAWVDYISKVYRGEISASEESIRNFILDYAASIYFFLCGPDGETILFWTKYTGVFPTNIPASEAAWQKGKVGNSESFSISYSYAWKEDFNPAIIEEFNRNAHAYQGMEHTKSYSNISLSTGPTFATVPWIDVVKRDGSYEFKLRFKH